MPILLLIELHCNNKVGHYGPNQAKNNTLVDFKIPSGVKFAEKSLRITDELRQGVDFARLYFKLVLNLVARVQEFLSFLGGGIDYQYRRQQVVLKSEVQQI